jgi:hypothetical protein
MPACSDFLVSSMPGWENAAIRWPIATAAATTSSCTDETRPTRSASSAPMSRPVSISSAARVEPIARGRK